MRLGRVTVVAVVLGLAGCGRYVELSLAGIPADAMLLRAQFWLDGKAGSEAMRDVVPAPSMAVFIPHAGTLVGQLTAFDAAGTPSADASFVADGVSSLQVTFLSGPAQRFAGAAPPVAPSQNPVSLGEWWPKQLLASAPDANGTNSLFYSSVENITGGSGVPSLPPRLRQRGNAFGVGPTFLAGTFTVGEAMNAQLMAYAVLQPTAGETAVYETLVGEKGIPANNVVSTMQDVRSLTYINTAVGPKVIAFGNKGGAGLKRCVFYVPSVAEVACLEAAPDGIVRAQAGSLDGGFADDLVVLTTNGPILYSGAHTDAVGEPLKNGWEHWGSARALVFEDLDGDKLADLAIVSGSVVAVGRGDGKTIGPPRYFAAPPDSTAIVAAKMASAPLDTALKDLVVASGPGKKIRILGNRGGLWFDAGADVDFALDKLGSDSVGEISMAVQLTLGAPTVVVSLENLKGLLELTPKP